MVFFLFSPSGKSAYYATNWELLVMENRSAYMYTYSHFFSFFFFGVCVRNGYGDPPAGSICHREPAEERKERETNRAGYNSDAERSTVSSLCLSFLLLPPCNEVHAEEAIIRPSPKWSHYHLQPRAHLDALSSFSFSFFFFSIIIFFLFFLFHRFFLLFLPFAIVYSFAWMTVTWASC